MDEQFRILGRERQADLDREARRFALADHARRDRVVLERVRPWLRRAASMFLGAERTLTPHRSPSTHAGGRRFESG
jgi:hypothetical protein